VEDIRSREKIATGLTLDEANELCVRQFNERRMICGVQPERMGGDGGAEQQVST
jgi:hypothetical protein